MSQEKNKLVIIGAGISGLSFAHYCAINNLNSTILEKDKTIGGTIQTECINDFWLELGTHTLYNSYANLLEVLDYYALTKTIIKRKKLPYKILQNSHISKISKHIKYLELFLSLPNLFLQKKENQTVSSYYSKILGKKNYQNLFAHCFNAVHCQESTNSPADLIFKKRTRNKNFPRSFTLKKGISQIINSISKNPNIEIKTNTNILKITFENNTYKIHLYNNKIIQSKYLAIATPPDIAANLIQTHSPKISHLLSQIKTTLIESLGLIYRPADQPTVRPLSGFIGINKSFYSAISMDIIPHNTSYKGVTFHFQPNCLSKQEKIDKICKILNIKESQVSKIFTKTSVLPSFQIGHQKIIAEITNNLKNTPLFLTGNYFSGMALEECFSHSKTETGRLFKSY